MTRIRHYLSAYPRNPPSSVSSAVSHSTIASPIQQVLYVSISTRHVCVDSPCGASLRPKADRDRRDQARYDRRLREGSPADPQEALHRLPQLGHQGRQAGAGDAADDSQRGPERAGRRAQEERGQHAAAGSLAAERALHAAAGQQGQRQAALAAGAGHHQALDRSRRHRHRLLRRAGCEVAAVALGRESRSTPSPSRPMASSWPAGGPTRSSSTTSLPGR